MIDITHKYRQLRSATAGGKIITSAEVIRRIQDHNLPKGNLFEVARTAALLGAKNTDRLLPHCHPIPLEFLEIDFTMTDNEIHISATGKTIARTGLEMEVLTAVSIAALSIYDMLKPIDKNLAITDLRLTNKTGGKSSVKKSFPEVISRVIVVSDSTSSGKREDLSGAAISKKLQDFDLQIQPLRIIPDSAEQIDRELESAVNENIDFLVFTGGTGVGSRDITTEIIEPRLQKRLPGVEEAMRSFGQERNAKAMLSRSLAGISGQTLVLCLPGSLKGSIESMDAVLPHIFHALEIIDGQGHT